MRLHDQIVANLAHEHHDPTRGVVVVRVLPHQHHEVHDRFEQLHQALELVLVVLQLREVLIEGLQKQQVIVRLDPSVSHLLAQLLKRGKVRALGDVQHRHHLANLRPRELLVNRVQVGGFIFPELELRQRSRMFSVVPVKRLLRVRLQHTLDLPGPRDDRGLQHVDLVRGGRPVGSTRTGRFARRHR